MISLTMTLSCRSVTVGRNPVLLEGYIIDHGERSWITHRRSVFAVLPVMGWVAAAVERCVGTPLQADGGEEGIEVGKVER